ncbi:MAG: hypothetical protein IT357_10565 [Gemmatimonadaceae bacterium]|nr:hypothetical protein [Gemmatimonadaceae bacterium]
MLHPPIRRALLWAPLAATATFVAIPTLMALIALTSSQDLWVVVGVAVMVGLSFGVLALAASVVATLALYLGAQVIGLELTNAPLWVLLTLGALAAGALVAGGRVWLANEVDWAMLWTAVPAGLVGAAVFWRTSRSRRGVGETRSA